MKILILTPLFPPDTTPSAQYAKELTRRLSQQHKVTTLLYGHLPEQVSEASLISVDKGQLPPLRLFRYLKQLFKLVSTHDLILIQNGPSTELPCLLTPHLTRATTILMESDNSAPKRNSFFKLVRSLLIKRVSCVFDTTEQWPQPRPMIHPLKPRPETSLTVWDRSWETHLQSLFTKCDIV